MNSKSPKYPKIAPQKLMWKESPPGPEQIELDRLFADGEIDDLHTPNNVRLANPIFLDFTPRVFGLHFRKTKAKFGLMRK